MFNITQSCQLQPYHSVSVEICPIVSFEEMALTHSVSVSLVLEWGVTITCYPLDAENPYSM